MTSAPVTKTRPKTKIVCTLGPATESLETIKALIQSGMSVARLNLSHGSLETHAIAVATVRQASAELGIPVGIMVDVPGSKYRTGPLAPGAVQLRAGDRLVLTSRDIIGTQEIVSVTPPGIHRDARPGSTVLLDDGLMELRVISVDRQQQDVLCEVVRGGRLTERRGVIIPGVSPSQPFPTEKGEEGLRFAAQQQAEFVALSMVRGGSDVRKARDILRQNGLHDVWIISKVELAEALQNFDSVLEASDAVMVARGDLGVEIPLAQVPVKQKYLIAKCNAAGKPVITATQMLESMINYPTPTRAEVTDVANAVYDGTDAVMLSGETSIGQYPVQVVEVMAEVAREAEAALPYETILRERMQNLQNKTDDMISYNAVLSAQQLNASLIIAFTESGGTAGRVSKYRPKTPILALTHDEGTRKRLTLRWGVTPVVVQRLRNVEDFFARGEEQAVKVARVQPGSRVVLVAGVPIGVPGGTNLLRVMTVSSAVRPD
jgi:pyruvate kinase